MLKKYLRIIKLILSFVIVETFGYFASVITSASVSGWYSHLNKPFFTPTGGVISFVWNIIFILKGISLFLIWDTGIEDKPTKIAISVFFIQISLSLLWSYFFFGLMSPFLALLEIIILWVAIMINILCFYRVSKEAAYLLLPYFLWVGFATILNYFIWILNII